MKRENLHLYSIMPLDTDHIEEICEDIRAQYESGVATCALFSMTLVPEGNPPADKVGLLCEKYDLFRNRLKAMGIGCGVLVQASIGHGWTLGELFPYQQYTQLIDGKKTFTVCPADEGFRAYIRHVFATIAAHAPDHIMLDDDFRLLFRTGGGHGMGEEASKTACEAAIAYLQQQDSMGNEVFSGVYDECQRALLQRQKEMQMHLQQCSMACITSSVILGKVNS